MEKCNQYDAIPNLSTDHNLYRGRIKKPRFGDVYDLMFKELLENNCLYKRSAIIVSENNGAIVETVLHFMGTKNIFNIELTNNVNKVLFYEERLKMYNTCLKDNDKDIINLLQEHRRINISE